MQKRMYILEICGPYFLKKYIFQKIANIYMLFQMCQALF